jgi:hypothetical protein
MNNFAFFFQKTSRLLTPTHHAGSFLVPSRGWFIYGGANTEDPNSQPLQSLSGNWETGPRVYDLDHLLCSVQVLCKHLESINDRERSKLLKLL